MQTATSETESKSRDLSICVHHYTLRAPCPKGQGIRAQPMKSQPAKRRNSDLVGGLPANVRNTVHSVGGLRHAIVGKVGRILNVY